MTLFQLSVVALGVFLGFFVQTIIGFAAVLVALPILLTVLELRDAVVFISLLLAVFSILLIYQNYRDMELGVVREVGGSGFIGLVAGLYLLTIGNPALLKQGLGLFILLYAAYVLWSGKRVIAVNRFGLLFGFIGGIFSGLYSTGGPLYVSYITNRLEDKRVLRATLLGTLGWINLSRLPVMVYRDMIIRPLLQLALISLPVLGLAIGLGNRVVDRLDRERFTRIIIFVLLLAGLSLLINRS